MPKSNFIEIEEPEDVMLEKRKRSEPPVKRAPSESVNLHNYEPRGIRYYCDIV